MTEQELAKLILENWQVVFLYGLKYLKDISAQMRVFEKEIAVLQYAIRERDRNKED
jgi:hypothetical protein